MTRRNVAGKVVAALSASVLSFTIIATAASPASATRRTAPKITWHFVSARVNAGTSIRLDFQVTGVPKGGLVHLNRTFGSKHVWKQVLVLHPGKEGKGSANAPAVQMGHYEYEVVVAKNNRTLAASPARPLWAYGSVSYNTICSDAYESSSENCGSGTIQLGSHVFTYEAEDPTEGETSPPGVDALVFSSRTSCRSGSLTVGVGQFDNPDPGQSATLQVTQSTLDPQSIKVGDQSTRAFHFNLDGGPIYFDLWSSDGSESVYWAGTFSCYTLNALA